jgi:hypothetical protein
MIMGQTGKPLPPERRTTTTSLTHIAKRALSHYGLGNVQPVLLEDLTELLQFYRGLGAQSS